jgi:hypothetical protein
MSEKSGYACTFLDSSGIEEYFREHGDEAMLVCPTVSYWAPPIHDGLYHVGLAVDCAYNIRCPAVYKRTGQRYERVYLKAEIIRAIEQFVPGDFVGWKLHFSVDTLSFGGQPSRLTRLLQAIGKSDLRHNPSTLLELLGRTSPELLVQVVWKAYSRNEGRNILTGMRGFPQADNGTRLHTFCRYGEVLRARAEVVDYRLIPPSGLGATTIKNAPIG